MIQEANLHWRHIDTESQSIIMPWYTLPCLQWLLQQPTKTWKVFEYGGGYSSIWWRLNSLLYKGIDSNEFWAIVGNILFTDKKQTYIESCCFDKWDCIIVDGIEREECVKWSLDYIKPGGYLIIDNYGSEDYKVEETQELLKDWKVQYFRQPNHSTWQTAVFQKP